MDAAPYRYEPWEFNDISGSQIISPIIENIDKSPFVVADITYLNNNITYEVGFAIGRRKKVLLLRHGDIVGDKALANSVGIYDTLGYRTYSTEEQIRNMLTSHVVLDPIPFDSSINTKAPVYVMPSPGRAEASSTLISRIKKARYRYRSFSASEDVRLSAPVAISQVAQSAGVIILLDDLDKEQMLRSMFVAGLADGMEKPLLLLSQTHAKMPLDIRDQVKGYKDQVDIADIVADFCPEINSKLQDTAPKSIASPNMLARTSIGDPTAENEMTTLENYYLQTDQYFRALRGEVNLIVGRKGSGKTALFIRLRDTVRADKRNIVVDLKPESYQLLKLKDEILTHLAEGSRQHLITAFWEYLILLEVTYKLLEKDQHSYLFNHEIREQYEELKAIYDGSKGISEGDFSERMSQLSRAPRFLTIFAGR